MITEIKEKHQKTLNTKQGNISMNTIKNEVSANYTVTSIDEDAIIKQALDILARRLENPNTLEAVNAEVVKDYLKINLASLEHEVFSVLFLNNQHKLIAYEVMFTGTIDSCGVYPREVAKKALEHNAAAVILAHNHPSGSTIPSDADKAITNKIANALSLLDIRTLDHFIVGKTMILSFAESGLI